MDKSLEHKEEVAAPPAVRAEVQRRMDLFAEDRKIKQEMENLRRYLARMDPQASLALYKLLRYLGQNDAICQEELIAALEQFTANSLNKKKELAHAMSPLLEWWVAQGRVVSKTLRHQNPGENGGNAPLIDFLIREHEAASGRGITPNTARYIVNQNGRNRGSSTVK